MVLVTTGAAAGPTQIVGKWTGTLKSTSGSASRLTVTVAKGELEGTWYVSDTCHGTLKLKDISNGFHHYYRIAVNGASCPAGGVDCLERDGAGVLDEYVNADNVETDGVLRRKT